MKSFFVSSTFCDMQAERDILHQRVFPRIRKQLEPYGEDIEGLDLRWGVDTSNMSEKESGKQLLQHTVIILIFFLFFFRQFIICTRIL